MNTNATWTTDNGDKVRVWTSPTCQLSWVTVFTETGDQLLVQSKQIVLDN